MPTVAVYFSEPGIYDNPFNYTEFLESYRELSEACLQENIRFVVVRAHSYDGNMTFSHGWEFNAAGELEAIDQPIKVDLIYMKATDAGFPYPITTENILNHPELDHICRDKMATYDLFGDTMKTSLVATPENSEAVLKAIDTDLIVLKPTLGESGEGIMFISRAEYSGASVPTNEPYLAQAFLDASDGVAGLITGRHDLRVVMANGKPVITYFRIAKEGSLLSNTAQGATVHPIDLADLPESCLHMSEEIDAKLARFNPRMYSIDFMFEHNKPYVTELNSRPGIPHASWVGEQRALDFRNALISLFKDSLTAR